MYIGPYEILERIGPVAYRLALPPKLAKLHNVFHVLILRRCHYDESHILHVQDIQVQSDFTFDEEPKAILDRELNQLWDKQVSLVKVLLATPQYGRNNLGTKIYNEGTVSTTLQFR